MTSFVGRGTELAVLRKRLDRAAASGSGAALAIRGRRQVGKSRLVQEFCDRADVPYVYFTANKGASPVESIAMFLADLRDSSLARNPASIPDHAANWVDAFRILAGQLPQQPSIVVLDEVPWLSEQDSMFDGALQNAWDRLLSQSPTLLLLLGSDIHMMERMTAYDRPFFGRADNLALGPLNPAEVGAALDLSPADAIDAHLISGGLPGVLRGWPSAMPPMEFVKRECADPAAAIFSIPESSLLAEFPSPDHSRRVLEAIGGGDRTHATIAAAAGSREGDVPSGTLSPVLRRLTEDKRILALDTPLSTVAGKPGLYRVSDSSLRLYLAVGRSAQDLVSRGRSDMALRLFQRRWSTWRGRAVEPLIRESVELAALGGELPWPDVEAVGAWWNRRFDPEVDLVGADRSPVAKNVFFTGSIKWLDTPFDAHDAAAATRGGAEVPGADSAGLMVVSRSGISRDVDLGSNAVVWTADEVVDSWR
ncbi:AAA family ATPase [Nocardia camponoti]|uniref:ATPase n=1 Tax=Nocardia camponoti TaxID=1616106 RepID=A0A917QA21_9NOCA|nr:ATP-binding protein [Nocardia camponoti]GGK38583.1 ATPase [Nocardia camponoti]